MTQDDFKEAVRELERVIKTLSDEARRLKKMPIKQFPPENYVDAKTACQILGIKRAVLDRLADRKIIARQTIKWNTFFSLRDVLRRFVEKGGVKVAEKQFSPPQNFSEGDKINDK